MYPRYRCKQCGGISLTGKYCMRCDDKMIDFMKRRLAFYPLITFLTLALVGVFFNDVLWLIGIFGILSSPIVLWDKLGIEKRLFVKEDDNEIQR